MIHRTLKFSILTSVLTMLPSALAAEKGVVIQIDAGAHARRQTPVIGAAAKIIE